MTRVITIHSYRGGTGKSNAVANLAALLAQRGKRVGVIDADIQSPGLHILFGIKGRDIPTSLNDYLHGETDIREIAQDVTPALGSEVKGHIFFTPSSIKAGQISEILRHGYDVHKLTHGLAELNRHLSLDVLIIDTHPGLNEETILALGISHSLLILMRPDHQDYEGTELTLMIARQLHVPHPILVVNKVPSAIKLEGIRSEVEKTYECEVAVVIPHSEDFLVLGSKGIFVAHHPDHPITELYGQLADRAME